MIFYFLGNVPDVPFFGVTVRFWYGVVTPVSVWVCVHILHEILEDSIFLTWYVLILFFFDLILSEPGFFVSESRIM